MTWTDPDISDLVTWTSPLQTPCSATAAPCDLSTSHLKCTILALHKWNLQPELTQRSCLHCLLPALCEKRFHSYTLKIPSPGLPYKNIAITHKFRSPALSVIFILSLHVVHKNCASDCLFILLCIHQHSFKSRLFLLFWYRLTEIKTFKGWSNCVLQNFKRIHQHHS